MNIKMKNYQSKLTIFAIAFLASLGVNAADVTTVFNNGDTLTATQMTEIKDAANSKQNRVTGVCDVGQSIRVVNADGTVTCEVDTDTNTTYTAGSGISISDTTISARVGADIAINQTTVLIPQGSTAETQVASVTVSAPSSGLVLVTHSGYVVIDDEPNTIILGIGDTNNARDVGVQMGSRNVASTRQHIIPYSVQNLYTVSAAGTFTYFGLAQKNTTDNAGSVVVVPRSMSAIFIPNRY